MFDLRKRSSESFIDKSEPKVKYMSAFSEKKTRYFNGF